MNDTDDIVTIPSPETRAVEAANYRDMVDIITAAEAAQALFTRMITLAIKTTNENDWVDQQGTPYLMASGAEKVGALFGIEMVNVRHEKKLLDGPGHFMYCHTATFRFGHREIEVQGACSTHDKFFGRKGGEELLPAEIDEVMILKKSFNNAEVNGIKRLVGLRNLTWEQVAAAGVDVARVKGVRYEGGKKGGAGQTAQSKAELEADDGRRKELRAWVLEMAEGDIDGAKTMLAAMTTFEKDGQTVAGVQSVDALKGKRLEIAWGKAKKEHAEWAKSRPQQEPVGAGA